MALVKTQDLYEFVLNHPEKVERRRNREDGTEFIVVWADDLRAAGVDVRQGGSTYDVNIRLRDGKWWSPSGFENVDEDEWDDEDWTDEDEDKDEYCMYCGVGLVSSGEVCPSCGTFQV